MSAHSADLRRGAMMLPLVAPFGYMYALGMRSDRAVRLAAFFSAAVVAWRVEWAAEAENLLA